MLLLPRSTKIYMGCSPVRLNKSFDGLSNVVRSVLQEDPLSGHIFIFSQPQANDSEVDFTDAWRLLDRGRAA